MQLPPGARSVEIKDGQGRVIYSIKSSGGQIASAVVSFYTPTPKSKPASASHKPSNASPTPKSKAAIAKSATAAAAKATGVNKAPSTATPSPMPSIYIGGAEGAPSATMAKPHVASVTASPLPTSTPDPSGLADQSVAFKITGKEPGTTALLISDGGQQCAVDVAVLPVKNRFGLTAGIGTSNIAVNSFTSTMVPFPATPTPAAGATPGPPLPNTLYVYKSESSHGQTFVPLLGHYRITDNPFPFNLFASAGFAASGERSKQLYGLSYGNEDFLFTLGEHTQTVDYLTPPLHVGPNVLAGNVPAPPLTFSSRVTRPFLSATFQLCLLTGLIPSLGGTGCPNSPSQNDTGGSNTASTTTSMPSTTPSASPSPSPSPPATSKAKKKGP